MKRLRMFASVFAVALAAVFAGCDREASTTKTETTTTPGGETTVETTKTIESSGDHPPTVDGHAVPKNP